MRRIVRSPDASSAGTTTIQYGVMASAIIGIIVVGKGILGPAIIGIVNSIGG